MSDIYVYDCTFYKTDENGEEICNKDGSTKVFTCNEDFDWSGIAESVDDDDLEEVDDE